MRLIIHTAFMALLLLVIPSRILKRYRDAVAALEALGVDNARIEVEGTGELPILDGSAYPFCYHAARVGVVRATASGAEDDSECDRFAWRLDEPVTVRHGDAFVSLYPDSVTKLTYGVDFTYKSRAIGKQWESWTPTEDGRFADVLARARTFANHAVCARRLLA